MVILKLKKKFYCHKTPILLGDVDVENVLVSYKISFDEKNYKYSIGYLYDNDKGKPFHIKEQPQIWNILLGLSYLGL